MATTTPSSPTRLRRRGLGSTILAALVFIAAVLAGLALSPVDVIHADPVAAIIGLDPPPAAPPTAEPGDPDGGLDRPDRWAPATPLGEADGVVPDGVTVFDDESPAVVNLDPDLLRAVRLAAKVAAADGIVFIVNSGWRSPAYQEQLMSEAIAEYGSAEEAARWVASVEASAHVSGDAVDIGPVDAAAWLAQYGAAFGLCQIYENEPWHYELRPDAVTAGCPPMYPDASRDPRSQQ